MSGLTVPRCGAVCKLSAVHLRCAGVPKVAAQKGVIHLMSLTTDSPASHPSPNGKPKRVTTLEQVTVRFAGDSGDGMQLAGTQFTDTSRAGRQRHQHAFPTSPPRSARPPAPLPGVSGFQIHFSSTDIFTPGDEVERAGRDEPGRPQDQHRKRPRRTGSSSSTKMPSTQATSKRRATRPIRWKTARFSITA